MIATVSVPLLEDRSELGWMVGSADRKMAVLFAEDPASVGILLCRETVVKKTLILDGTRVEIAFA